MYSWRSGVWNCFVQFRICRVRWPKALQGANVWRDDIAIVQII
uniref:Uncharacterized protein n=1 Tax=Arundo donax TaxID=35708 RepID=A0A0A8Z4M6_ARUDO